MEDMLIHSTSKKNLPRPIEELSPKGSKLLIIWSPLTFDYFSSFLATSMRLDFAVPM